MSELTIQIAGKDDRLAVSTFLDIVAKTVATLRLLDAKLSPNGLSSSAWEIVKASMSSPLTLTLAPALSETDEDASEKVLHAYLRGLLELERSPEPPPYFDENVLKSVRPILGHLGNGIESIRYHSPNEPSVAPTLHAAANIDTIVSSLTKQHFEYGTIEGTLEVVSTHKTDTIVVWEVFTKRRVECRVTPEQLEQAKTALRHRVAVTGKIRYRRADEPATVEVESIRVLRASSQLPQPSSMGKVDLTGGASSEDYIGELRDAE
jgi:hypothetical protein